MSNGSKPETMAERRHRMWKGRGLCHVHSILRGGVEVCGQREGRNGVRLCEKHAEAVLNALKPNGSTVIGRDALARLHRDSMELSERRAQERPLHDEIRDLRREIRDLKSLPPSRRRRREAPTAGHVYFLLSDNLVKIGWASDLDARLKAYSPGARLLAVMPGTKQDEGRMHKKFGDLKTNRREWFTYHPRVMEEVERIVREHGDPPRDLNEPMQTKRIVGPRLTNYIGGDRKVLAAGRTQVVRG